MVARAIELTAPWHDPLVMARADLRPLERRVLALREAGVSDAEIARRFHRSPGYVKRLALLANARRTGPDSPDHPSLTPIERRVLKWRARGVRPEQMAWRFKRSPAHIERVERLARYKLDRARAGA
jgi:DNA-binding CsgD family transcriptional regulator